MASIFFLFKNLATPSKIRFLIGAIILLVFQIWSTYKGAGTAKTFDSLQYLKTTENLILQQDFIRTDSQPYIEWALGFPILLIFFKDSILLNLFCIIGSYIFYFDLTQKLFQKTITKYWLIIAFVTATPLYLIHHFVWSEPPFLLFLIITLWAFYYLICYDNLQKTNSIKQATNRGCINYLVFLFCLFGLLFCAMRNAGLYFVIGINSGIIIFYLYPSLIKKENKLHFSIIEFSNIIFLLKNIYIKSLIYFSISSILPIFLWWLHAKIKTKGGFDTVYNLALRTFSEECLNYGDILSRWIFPPSIPLLIRIYLLGLAILSLLFLFIKNIKFKNNINSKFILFIFWINLVYLIGMLISRAGMKIDAERFLAILYPFLCILIGFVIDKIKMNNFLKYGIAFVWLIYPLLRTLKNVIFWN